jgi:carboxypeptidase C (cathepsin A)
MGRNMTLLRTLVVALLALAAPASTLLAQDQPARRPRPERAVNAEPKGDVAGVLRLLPADVSTDHTVTVAGKPLAYTATAGTFSLFNQNGERSAAIFYTAYVAKGADTGNRPVTFVFNGGPGAASAFLNLGLAGPRVVAFGPDNRDGALAKLVDNPDTWLAFTDLVMIDPVGTGWSRAAKSDDASNFWGVDSDAESIAKVIALYVAHNSRTRSPKYLLGESYGGFRAAKVARALQNDQGIVPSGIVMLSPMLEASLQWGSNRFALGAALHFPSLVAAELERTKGFTPQALAEAERFALTDYLTTLAGPPPKGDAAKAFYGRIAQMTGLRPEVVAKARGYVRGAFLNHLREDGMVASSYDASFRMPDPFPESESSRSDDPMLDGFARALSGNFVGYARDELGFKTDITYILLNHSISGKWNWGGRLAQPGVTGDLRELLALNPSFRLLVAHGLSDLVTPYGVSRYLLDSIPDAGLGRVALKTYRGGHMFYFNEASRRAFAADVRAFYQNAP